jgi:multicomponent Na+:H+ antiporter subunit E
MIVSPSRQPIAKNAPCTSALVADWVKCACVFTLQWLLLTQGAWSSWVIGLFVVPAATWCAMVLFRKDDVNQEQAVNQPEGSSPPATIQILAVPGFLTFFLWQSLRGGWDSALFAIDPRRHLRSGFVRYTTDLPAGRARLIFVHIVSLLPGTVSADWQEDMMVIHALDTSCNNHQSLQQCEVQVARLFGINLVDRQEQAISQPTPNENGGAL